LGSSFQRNLTRPFSGLKLAADVAASHFRDRRRSTSLWPRIPTNTWQLHGRQGSILQNTISAEKFWVKISAANFGQTSIQGDRCHDVEKNWPKNFAKN
jgi:hypothetical protein